MTIYHNIKNIAVLASIATTLTLTACGGSSGENNSQSNNTNQPGNPGKSPVSDSAKKINLATLEDNKWTLLDARDSNLKRITNLYAIKGNIKLNFAKEASTPRLEFGLGCNNYTSDYEFKDDYKIVNNKVTGTEKYCEHLDVAEKKLASMMKKDSKLSITKAGTTTLLSMTFADGSYLLWDSKSEADYKAQNDQLKASLKKYNWKLHSASITKPTYSSSLKTINELINNKDNTTIDFGLNADTVSYSVGCNKHNGNYKLENEGVMTVSNVSATQTVCNEDIQKAEFKINKIMAKEAKLVVSVDGTIPKLYQTTTDIEQTEQLEWHGTLKN